MKPQTARTLALLEDGPKCSQQLVDGDCGYRYGARIGELRELGYRVVKDPERCRLHRHRKPLVVYRLVGPAQMEMTL